MKKKKKKKNKNKKKKKKINKKKTKKKNFPEDVFRFRRKTTASVKDTAFRPPVSARRPPPAGLRTPASAGRSSHAHLSSSLFPPSGMRGRPSLKTSAMTNNGNRADGKQITEQPTEQPTNKPTGRPADRPSARILNSRQPCSSEPRPLHSSSHSFYFSPSLFW